MKSTTVNRVAIAVIALGLALAGCSSSKPKETAPSPTAPPAAGPTAPSPGAPPTSSTAPPAAGHSRTIASYIKQNSIVETHFKRGEPGVPAIGLPLPQGWEVAAPNVLPDYAYSAIIYTGPESAEYTPNITAILSKLTGNVDSPTIVRLAPGELNNLPGYTPPGIGEEGTLAGFPGWQLRGAWNSNGQIKYIAQKTVVMPAPDGVYVLQLNADGLDSQDGILNPAMDTVDNDTTIAMP